MKTVQGKINWKVILLCGAVAMAILLSGCGGGLKGTYSAETSDGIEATITFDGSDHFVISMLFISLEGTYRIRGNQITMTMKDPITGEVSSETSTFQKSGNSIFIEDVEYKLK